MGPATPEIKQTASCSNCLNAQAFGNCARRFAGIGGARDGPADHQHGSAGIPRLAPGPSPASGRRHRRPWGGCPAPPAGSPAPSSARRRAISCAEHTTPSRPHCWASARQPQHLVAHRRRQAHAGQVFIRQAGQHGDGDEPGRRRHAFRGLDAARIIAAPPWACTLRMETPSCAAARHAPATVLGMSWNFRSRKTGRPIVDKGAHAIRTRAVKNSSPSLKPPT